MDFYQQWTSYFLVNFTVNYDYPHGKKFELIAHQYDFAAGWFTCGEEVITPVPESTSAYTS